MKKVKQLLLVLVLISTCVLLLSCKSGLVASRKDQQKAIETANEYVAEYLDAEVKLIQFYNGFEPQRFYVQYETGNPAFRFKVAMSKDFTDLSDNYFEEYYRNSLQVYYKAVAQEIFEEDIEIYISPYGVYGLGLKKNPELDRFMSVEQILKQNAVAWISVDFNQDWNDNITDSEIEKILQFAETLRNDGLLSADLNLCYQDFVISLGRINKITDSEYIIQRIENDKSSRSSLRIA